MSKKIIIFLDPDGDPVEFTHRDSTSDDIFALCRILTKQYGEEITPYYADVQIGAEYTDRLEDLSQLSKGAADAKEE